MAVAIYTHPTTSNSGLAAHRSGWALWAKQISAALQSLGATKTSLYGTGWVNALFSDWYADTSQTSVSYAVPLNVQLNDYMLVTVAVASGTTVATPSGWSLLYTDTAAGGTGPIVQYVFSRFATSADVGTGVVYTWTLSASVTVASGLNIYRGVDTTTPVNISGVASSSVNGTTATAPTVTTTVPNALVVQCWAADMTTTSLAFSAGTPRVYNLNAVGAGGPQMAMTDSPQLTAGATPQPTATLGSTGSWVVRTIALTPLAGTFAIQSITDTPTGGTLADATYAYRIVATNAQGHTIPCAEVTHVVANGTGTSTTTITWNVVPNATGYQVYGRTSGSELLMATLASPNGSVLSWTDNGSITPAGAMPTSDTTTDTGQVNFGNVGQALSIGLTLGYEILQFTDSQQAYSPVFVRITYGTASGNLLNPQIGLATGTSTDGAGNLTSATAFPGTVRSVQNWYTTGGNSAITTVPLYVDSDGGASIMIGGWYNPPLIGSALGGVILVERTRNWDGTPNGEGIILLVSSPANTNAIQTIIANAAVYTTQPSIQAKWPFVNCGMSGAVPQNSMATGTTVFTVPIFTGETPRLNGPSKHVVGVMLSDLLGANVQFTIQPYGANHTFNGFGLTSIGVTLGQVHPIDAQVFPAIRIA